MIEYVGVDASTLHALVADVFVFVTKGSGGPDGVVVDSKLPRLALRS